MEMQIKGSSGEIAEALFERAVVLWGRERAAELRPTLRQTAEYLWELSRSTPEKDVEPGFLQLDGEPYGTT